MVCLDNLVGKRFRSPKGGSLQGRFYTSKSFARVKGSALGVSKSWGKPPSKWRKVTRVKAEDHKASVNKKNWRVAVLVFKFSAFLSWCHIQEGLNKTFNGHRFLTPLAADRVVLWCLDEEDKRRMEKMGFCVIPDVGEVKFVRWNPDSQLTNLLIACSDSWIGIEGLPLNLWNQHVFNVLGSKCGGLLEISRSTVDLTCLTHAEVKLKGLAGGFIQESMDIFCWGKRVKIKFFPLNKHKPGILMGGLHEVVEEADMAGATVNLDVTQTQAGRQLPSEPDTGRKARVAGRGV